MEAREGSFRKDRSPHMAPFGIPFWFWEGSVGFEVLESYLSCLQPRLEQPMRPGVLERKAKPPGLGFYKTRGWCLARFRV